MQTAEGGKDYSCSKGQGDSQEHCQELVNHIFADFKESMAADPHFVKGVRRQRLCDHIFEAHLQEKQQERTCWDALSSVRVTVGAQEFG